MEQPSGFVTLSVFSGLVMALSIFQESNLGSLVMQFRVLVCGDVSVII